MRVMVGELGDCYYSTDGDRAALLSRVDANTTLVSFYVLNAGGRSSVQGRFTGTSIYARHLAIGWCAPLVPPNVEPQTLP